MLRKWKVDFEGLNGTSFFCIFVFGIFAFFGVFSRKITCFLAFFGCFWMSKKVLKNGEKLAKMSVEKVLENHAKFGRKMARKSARKMTKNRWKKVLRNRQKSATKSPREFPDMTTAAQTAATRRTGLPGMMSWRVERALRRVAAANWREPRLLITRSSSGDPTSPSEGTRDQLKGRSAKRRGMARGNQGARKNGPQRRFY